MGRNNTAKTSCFECIGKVLDGTPFSFNDYPLSKRENLYANIASFMSKEIAFEDLCERLEPISITSQQFGEKLRHSKPLVFVRQLLILALGKNPIFRLKLPVFRRGLDLF